MKLFENGCLVQLSVSVWGGRIKLPSTLLQVDADPSLIRATKYLVDRSCLKPVEEVRHQARTFLYNKTLPFPVPGVLFIPKSLLGEVDETFQGYQKVFENKVTEFAENYDLFMNTAKLRLNGLFNPNDYPADIRAKFSFAWRFLVIDAPGKSGVLTPEIYNREKESFQRTIKEFQELAMTTLRVRFAEMVDHMVDRLSGEKKVFRDSMINNIRDFLNDFEKLNISNDAALGEQVERCRSILSGVDPSTLRSDQGFRKEIAKNIASVQGALDGMMIERPKRKIRLNVEKEAVREDRLSA